MIHRASNDTLHREKHCAESAPSPSRAVRIRTLAYGAVADTSYAGLVIFETGTSSTHKTGLVPPSLFSTARFRVGAIASSIGGTRIEEGAVDSEAASPQDGLNGDPIETRLAACAAYSPGANDLKALPSDALPFAFNLDAKGADTTPVLADETTAALEAA